MEHVDLKALENAEWIGELREALNDHSWHGSRYLGLGQADTDTVFIAAAVVEAMLRDPAIVGTAIMRLDKQHRDQIRVLLDKLEDVGM